MQVVKVLPERPKDNNQIIKGHEASLGNNALQTYSSAA
jgi:hypothetical protein